MQVTTIRHDGREIPVHVGEVVHLKGANGAGKTTLLRRLAGLDGDVTDCALVTQDARDGLIGLTVAGEARLRGVPVLEQADQDVATLSDGEATRLALYFARDKPLLLLDEAFAALDPQGRKELEGLIARQLSHGAVVYADHTPHTRPDIVIDLGGGEAEMPLLQPPPTGDTLEVPATAFTRGRTIRSPAARLGPGLHVVTGPNGCGKTSWLLAIAGLIPGVDPVLAGARPAAGKDLRMLLPGQRDHMRGDTVGEMLQGLDARMVSTDLLARHPLALSGGESRRVALTDVLGRPARVYLLDEPDRHLDAAGAAMLLAWMDERIQEGAIILAATHADWLIERAHHHIAWEDA